MRKLNAAMPCIPSRKLSVVYSKLSQTDFLMASSQLELMQLQAASQTKSIRPSFQPAPILNGFIAETEEEIRRKFVIWVGPSASLSSPESVTALCPVL